MHYLGVKNKKFVLHFYAISLLFALLVCPPTHVVSAVNQASPNSKEISQIEEKVFGSTHPNLTEEQRLSQIEQALYGTASSKLSVSERLTKISKVLYIPQAKVSDAFRQKLLKEQQSQKVSQNQPEANSGSKQQVAKTTKLELLPDINNLSEQMLRIVNQERSFRGLSPLEMDSVAQKVANEHASYLVQTKQFSHYGLSGSNPDLRYSEAGGGGKLEELVEGYFAGVDKNGKIGAVEANTETPNQLMDAILKVPDKADVVFANGANKAGISFVIGKDKRQLAVVINTVAEGGSFSALPKQASISEQVNVSGNLGRGYKFAWIGVSHKEFEKAERSEVEPSSYFAPIDQVVYLDKDSDRMKNVAKTLGVIGAMVAAPFTYGASMLVADILMQSVAKTYQAQDVAVRGGVKATDASFNSRLPMGEWGPGLYYITVWAFNGSKEKKPVIVSRRTLRVD
jgi:hypothetical protein